VCQCFLYTGESVHTIDSQCFPIDVHFVRRKTRKGRESEKGIVTCPRLNFFFKTKLLDALNFSILATKMPLRLGMPNSCSLPSHALRFLTQSLFCDEERQPSGIHRDSATPRLRDYNSCFVPPVRNSTRIDSQQHQKGSLRRETDQDTTKMQGGFRSHRPRRSSRCYGGVKPRTKN
jgi:hypothetical protein